MKIDLNDKAWQERYNDVSLMGKGEIISIEGIGDRDAYNPTLYSKGNERVLAFRCEMRNSSVLEPEKYHPQVLFARPSPKGRWQVDQTILPFDMMEDPFVLSATVNNIERVIFGGVRATLGESVRVNTDFYQGASLERLIYAPFAHIHHMKDVRLLQLPDHRFLLCRRPVDDSGRHGRIALHIIDNLDLLEKINSMNMLPLAILDSHHADDWVGVNSLQLLKDSKGTDWVGLLGHIAWQSPDSDRHYAAATYRIKLEDLLGNDIKSVQPHIVATRSCFEDGPYKEHAIRDVVFPGTFEHIRDQQYNLWAGLSDARIGRVLIENPFGLE